MIEKPSTPATQTAVNGAKATTMAVSVKVATPAMAESAVTGKAVTVTKWSGIRRRTSVQPLTGHPQRASVAP